MLIMYGVHNKIILYTYYKWGSRVSETYAKIWVRGLFLPFYCHVWAFSISWTRLSQNLEQANMTWEGVLLPRLTMYFIQIPKSLQNYSCTFKWMQYGLRNIYTYFTKEMGQWMVIQWVKAHTFIGQWMVEPFISTKGPVISSTTSP